MKKLILVRHGKSSWDHSGVPDFERPLAARGLRDAPRMASRLGRLGLVPDIILTSPAVRALATAEIFAEGLGLNEERLSRESRIYEAGPSTLLNIVQELHDSWECVMLVGHNPGFTVLMHLLTDDGPQNIPTSAYAVIALDTQDWSMVAEGGGRLLAFDFPKNPEAG